MGSRGLLWRAPAVLAAALHTLFFLGEAVFFTHPAVQERFRVPAGAGEALRVPMLNQGFYNLFLAAGCALGVALATKRPREGRTLVAYTCAFMVGAGIVLVCSEPRLVAGACVQALPPLLALLALRADRPADPAAGGD
ncbi:MAG: DUF1304 domain-containing protein [Planctomycetota bacterium]